MESTVQQPLALHFCLYYIFPFSPLIFPWIQGYFVLHHGSWDFYSVLFPVSLCVCAFMGFLAGNLEKVSITGKTDRDLERLGFLLDGYESICH